MPLNPEPLGQLLRHQRFVVTDCNDLASLDPLNFQGVRICNLTTPDYGNLKHVVVRSGSLRSNVSAPLSSVSLASSPTVSLSFCSCNSSFSNMRATFCN